jgi:hypothetical protein
MFSVKTMWAHQIKVNQFYEWAQQPKSEIELSEMLMGLNGPI